MTSAAKWLTVVCLAIAPCISHAADPAALAKRLHNAAEASSIDDPALKPWHLKLTFQLLDKKGATSEEGTIEEWWSAKNFKRVYTSPSYTATEVIRENKFYRTADRTSAPYLFQVFLREIVHPASTSIDLDKVTPELRVENFGKVKLDCIMLNQSGKENSFLPLGTYSTLCLDHGEDKLRVVLKPSIEHITRNVLGTFQGRSIPVDMTVSLDGSIAARTHIAELSVITADNSSLTSDDPQLKALYAVPLSYDVVVAASKISGPAPRYPEEDKHSQRSGTVHLRAIIGIDGHIHDLSVMDSPSKAMSESALQAVRQWVYKPFLVNGLPCPVETTITVNYRFGNG